MVEDLLQQFLQRESGPLVQFIKYAIGGGIATSVDILGFYLVAWKLLPALRDDDPVVVRLGLTVKAVTEAERSSRFIAITLIAFIFSNLTAYLINIYWVFEPGRHAWYWEVLLFYAVSGISIFIGTAIGWVMIKWFHVSTSFSYLSKIMAALLINFVCRKFFIFQG
ncbi:MAG TPA: GtrA family protein [Kiritimatiellia bacterium]|nr:GtrA family protein [Kiritimatiellia bacterium]